MGVAGERREAMKERWAFRWQGNRDMGGGLVGH
jgi:hypothetical protein